MGLDAASERQNRCKAQSTKTGGSSHRHRSRVEAGIEKSKPACRSRLLKTPHDNFMGLSFGNSLTPSRKSMPSRLSRVTSDEELKRGSIYQNSESVRKMKGLRTIQSSLTRDVSLTFTIIDSLSRPGQNEGGPLAQKKRSPQFSSDADESSTSVGKNYIESHSPECLHRSYHLPEDHTSTHHQTALDGPPDGFLEICLDSEDAAWRCGETVAEPVVSGSMEEPKFKCSQTSAPESDGNDLLERDKTRALSKTSSAKVGMGDSPYRTEPNLSKASPKSWFSPLRRMLDPIKKSMSQRDLPVSAKEIDGHAMATAGSSCIRRDRTLGNSLLHDFSNTAHKMECDGQLIKNDLQNSVAASSPAHLHGLLKLEYKHGIPSFEFSVKDPEDVFAAKTWRTDSAFNWVYTFHSLSSKRKSSQQKQPNMVGQMQVSCYLCSEMRNGGSLDTSTVTEFVLYDIVQARKIVTAQEARAGESLGTSNPKSTASSEPGRCTRPRTHALRNDSSDSSDHYPRGAMDLHSHPELAAIVIQVPFEKRESLKDKMGDKLHSGKEDLTLPDSDAACSSVSPMNVKVVTPSGKHGLPTTEDGGGPSKLLDRWRSGGGCDCGGWDMACPIVVFDNPIVQNIADYPENPWPLELFVQGSKEKVPALTITAVGEGVYAIDFHARLSTLEAFSICVALLHTVEVTTAVRREPNHHRLQCNSLKLLLEEEVRYLMEAVAEEEKRKAAKQIGEIPPCFVLDPPFSPIGRV